MKVYLNFTHPDLISKEVQPDSIYFKIVNPWMFTSQYGLQPRSEIDKTVMPFKIPPQLPNGVDEDSLKDMIQKAMGFIVGTQIVLAVCVKSAIARMWQLFFWLQMYCSIPILQNRLPALAELVVDNLKMVIFFEILKPEKLLPAIGV